MTVTKLKKTNFFLDFYWKIFYLLRNFATKFWKNFLFIFYLFITFFRVDKIK